LKWPGGKQWLAPLVTLLKPPRFAGTYYEPFLGAGALFFALAPDRAVLTDLNRDLILTYQTVASDVASVIEELDTYPYDARFYNALRKASPSTPLKRSSRFIYLNRTAFNGMFRVNSNGQFNVPFGRYVNPLVCPEDRLRSAAVLLEVADLLAADFASCETAQEGDWVYFDPPYTTGHQNNGFRKYNARLFSWDDQARLASLAQTLRDRGVHVLISNADHPAILDLYRSWSVVRVRRRTAVASSTDSRLMASEVLISTYRLRKVLDR
jgi:DNA adenine methylase